MSSMPYTRTDTQWFKIIILLCIPKQTRTLAVLQIQPTIWMMLKLGPQVFVVPKYTHPHNHSHEIHIKFSHPYHTPSHNGYCTANIPIYIKTCSAHVWHTFKGTKCTHYLCFQSKSQSDRHFVLAK